MDETEYTCPSCGEVIVIPIDLSQGREQQYVEDCPVCCSPVVIQIHIRKNGRIDCEGFSESQF